ncbi:primosomal protein [Caulobacter sp. DWR1-3-2b1]|uniref:primosomal protein n=1 Tax=Caulobacter sp. DWR1-3-2b1 TaxID=2804670 RepID=UPI003CE94E5C
MAELELDDAPDAQDTAEVLDETNLTRDGQDIANFDEIEDVYDVTQADGDSDEDEVDEGFDILDESELDDLADELEGDRDDESLEVDREPLEPVTGLDEDDEIGDVELPSDLEAGA